MKSVETVIDKALSAVKAPATAAARASAGRDHIDAINQLFAELELAYHNQFHKAFAAEGSLSLAKKYWLQSLAEFPPEVIRRATRHVVQHQEYLPTLASMIAACDNGHALFGLPTAEAAYREACLAPEPKVSHGWTHPAIYLAGRDTGWFLLASEPQNIAFPAFDYHYTGYCRRVMRGESLDVPMQPALPARVDMPLSIEASRARMKALRTRFDL